MKKALLLLGLYLVVVLLPLVLSWATGAPPRAPRNEIASALGMLAFSMILVEFVLSGRFQSISSGIGMDVTMRFHQLMARTALLFAVLHPLFYGATPAGGARPWDPTRELTLAPDLLALLTGVLAYILLPALVALAIGRRHFDYSYEVWRLIHGLGALVIAGLLLHHTLVAGRYAANPALVWLWSAMTAIAVATLIQVYVIAPIRQAGRPWRVTEVDRTTPRQWQVTVSPDGHAGLRYRAGQFAWLNAGHSPFSIRENPFSISSAPDRGPEISFLIKELGDFTSHISEIAIGTRAYLDGPYGHLCVDDRPEPGIALVAGGVGIAPMLGILRQLRATGDTRDVRIVYGNRTAAQIAFREELDTEDVRYVLSEPPPGWTGATGVIDPAFMDATFSDDEFRSWVFVLCGPKPMLDSLEDHLARRGVSGNRILSERFDYD